MADGFVLFVHVAKDSAILVQTVEPSPPLVQMLKSNLSNIKRTDNSTVVS